MRNIVEEYIKDELKGKKQILVDFDNTIVIDEWPYIGEILPGAIEVLRELQRNGHMLILYTLRSHNFPICSERILNYSMEKYGMNVGTIDILTPCIKLLNDNGIGLYDINQNHTWEEATTDTSRKIFSDYCIDDHNVGTPYIMMQNKQGEICKTVDWKAIDKWCVDEGLYDKPVLE